MTGISTTDSHTNTRKLALTTVNAVLGYIVNVTSIVGVIAVSHFFILYGWLVAACLLRTDEIYYTSTFFYCKQLSFYLMQPKQFPTEKTISINIIINTASGESPELLPLGRR
jgi:hypothetical protein